jgi:tRNA(fMet)-specific endonuclease VapC
MTALARGYVFDTDVLSAVLHERLARAASLHFRALPSHARCTTSVTVGELLYGLHKRRQVARLAAVRELLDGFQVLPFDYAAAERYAVLRADLEAQGRPLDEPDLRVAAIALVAGATLVTGNVQHFERVPGLTIENWMEDT